MTSKAEVSFPTLRPEMADLWLTGCELTLTCGEQTHLAPRNAPGAQMPRPLQSFSTQCSQ